MKTIELTDDQFQFLGSVIGHHLCGRHPETDRLYDKLKVANKDISFEKLSINTGLSRPDCIYLNAPMVGRVISYNVPAGRNNAACQQEIEAIIKKFSGEVISV